MLQAMTSDNECESCQAVKVGTMEHAQQRTEIEASAVLRNHEKLKLSSGGWI